MVSAAIVGAVAVTLVTLAALYPGFATADVSLNDGGVWVTRSADLMVGHLNYPSHALDGGLHSTTPDFTLLQDGNDVVMYDQASGSVVRIDPAKVAATDTGGVSPNSTVAVRGGALGVIDGESNGLYAARSDQLQGFSSSGRDPIAELGPGSAVTASSHGHIFAVSTKTHQLITLDAPDAEPVITDLPAFAEHASLSITAVGETPVVLDSGNGVLYTPDRTIQLPQAKQGQLQAAGEATDKVIIAGPTGLITQPLNGDKPTVAEVPEGGTPSQPYWLAGCAYGVWSGTGTYVRDCPGEANDRIEPVPGAESHPQLMLRQNRKVIVINELAQGTIWLVDQSMQQVDNWMDVIPPEADNGEEDSDDKQDQFKLPERTPKNHKPDAVDDKFGARAGATTTLTVLDNDTDPDGDLLSAALVGTAPTGVDVQPIRNGSALQVSLNPNISGSVKLRYQVDDGRENGTDEANITITVTPQGKNSPPAQHKVKTVQMEVGSKITYDALQGWYDPDGDDYYLKSASSKTDAVTFRNNGVIQITESARERGIREVSLVVSDGIDTFEGKLRVDVRARDTAAPVANSDRASTIVGDALTVSPLGNDFNPSKESLRLAKVPQIAGAKVIPDYAGGTFTFSSAVAGTYYIPYLASTGIQASAGLVRVDVKAKGADGLAPIAGRDTALVPTSREVLVDALSNDTDPTGGILVVQSVTVPQGSRVAAEVLEHRVIKIRDAGGLSAPVTLSYRVSNGAQWSDGQISVIPVKLPATANPPVAVNDQAIVRAGDIVTVDVLGNDYHPDGDTMKLLPELLETPDAADGQAFVSEGKVRFKAGPNAKQVSMVYQVTDSHLNVTSATLRLQIVAADDSNSAPRPEPVTARVIAGTTVRIPVPLDGIDPNGDSVELVGVGSAAAKGEVSVGDSWLVYKAYAGTTGRDSFDYVVRDRYGALATGSVVVGIAAPSNQNQAPYTGLDQVTVRPGRTVSVPVLTNDSDPDGDDVALVAKGLSSDADIHATVVKDRVVFTAPQDDGNRVITYTATDPFGARTPGTVSLKVAKDASLLPPVARDDRVPPSELGAEPTVVVDILANDEDPDGTAEDLTVTTEDPNAVVRTDKSLEVTLAPQSQVVLYTVTDQDSQSTSAVVFVPGTDTLLPTLKTAKAVEVVAGKQVKLPLADYVSVRASHTPKVAEADTARAGHADATPLIVDATNLQYTSAPDYYGPDSLGVQVTDGESVNDPKGNSAYVVIPILVLPAGNVPPTLADTSVEVAPGEDAAELNVRKLATDPNPGDLEKLTFAVTDVPAGFQAKLDGDQLQITADSGAAQGTMAEIGIQTTDGQSEPVLGKVSVRVVTSQRPLPVAVDDVIPSAYQGQPVEVDVLANDQPNPFPDVPLTVISAQVISGSGEARTDGSKVTVTPAADFHGTLEVRYRIQDATKTPERQAEASVLVTVQGRPDTPSRPVVDSVGDRTAVLTWSPPPNNGRPITGYTVASTARGFSQQCAATTCTLNGLTNDVEYTFTVVATNDVGDSDPSPASAVARPDVRPDQPQPPVAKFGDKSLAVTWATPHSSGSAVSSYDLEISPAPETGAPQVAGLTGNSYTWTGLANGTSYSLRVRAHNKADDPSDWSGFSVGEVPAGKPAAPGQPSTEPATPVGSQAQIKVVWPAVTGEAANGDEVSDYTLVVYKGGSEVNRFTLAGTSKAVNLDTSQTDFTFKVSARNKAGESPLSEASAPRRAAVAPGAPQNLKLTPKDQAVKVTFDDGDLNGNKAGELTYHYRLSPSGRTGTISSGESISGLSNGTSYTAELWATSSVAGVATGDSATSSSAIPFGKPIINWGSIESLDNAVRFHWTVNSNGRPITTATPAGICSSGSCSKDVPTDGGGSKDGTLALSYTNEAGTTSDSRTGQSLPAPSVTVYNDGFAEMCDSDPTSKCYFVGVSTHNFRNNTTCTIDGGYTTAYGTNESKRIGGAGGVYPNRGTNINFTINCGEASYTGKLPAP